MSLTTKASDISIRQLWKQGLDAKATLRAEQEGGKLGTLRGGNSGCVTKDGRGNEILLGKCGRLSHLRSLGLDHAAPDQRQLMFGAGYDNEDEWVGTLKLGWDGAIKREEEIPVRWQTSNGVWVTGRPDIVLGSTQSDSSFSPELGLELKLASALWTAWDVNYKFVPKTPHLVQAAHYAWQLGIPYKLLYTSRVDWEIPYTNWGMKEKLYGKHDTQDDAELSREGKPQARKILPFVREYDLWFENGVLWYNTQGLTKPVRTFITTVGIQEYYERVSRMGETKDLGQRPSPKQAQGFSMSYHPCDHCVLAQTCDQYEDSYDRWLEEARVVFETAEPS